MVDDTNVTRLFSSRDLDELFRLEHPDPIPDDEIKEYAPTLVSLPKSSTLNQQSSTLDLKSSTPNLKTRTQRQVRQTIILRRRRPGDARLTGVPRPHLQDTSAKDVIVGSKASGETVGGGGDKVIEAVLRGVKGKGWICKVKRHEDAVEQDNSEQLSKEEEEQANKEELEEDDRFQRSLHPPSSHMPSSGTSVTSAPSMLQGQLPPPPPGLPPLPPGWSSAVDQKSQREYYYNRSTQVSQWERPAAAAAAAAQSGVVQQLASLAYASGATPGNIPQAQLMQMFHAAQAASSRLVCWIGLGFRV